jgi:hypothetical protein
MASFTGPNIVTDGLVFTLDAANIRSYDPNDSNKTWYNSTNTRVVSSLELRASNNTQNDKINFGPNGRSAWQPTTDYEIQIGNNVDTSSVQVGDHMFFTFDGVSGSALIKILSILTPNANQRIFEFEVVETAGTFAGNADVSGIECSFTIYAGVPGANNLLNNSFPTKLKDVTVTDNAFQFNGVSTTLMETTGNNVVGSTAYTKMIWFRLASGAQSGNNNLMSSSSGGHILWVPAGNTLRAAHTDTSFSLLTSSVTCDEERWYHAAVTFNTTDGWVLYQDGKVVDTDATTSVRPGNGSTRIGGYGTSDYTMTGSLSCPIVYDRALTATEVLQNYNALKGRFGL